MCAVSEATWDRHIIIIIITTTQLYISINVRANRCFGTRAQWADDRTIIYRLMGFLIDRSIDRCSNQPTHHHCLMVIVCVCVCAHYVDVRGVVALPSLHCLWCVRARFPSYRKTSFDLMVKRMYNIVIVRRGKWPCWVFLLSTEFICVWLARTIWVSACLDCIICIDSKKYSSSSSQLSVCLFDRDLKFFTVAIWMVRRGKCHIVAGGAQIESCFGKILWPLRALSINASEIYLHINIIPKILVESKFTQHSLCKNNLSVMMM